jgi:sigma-54 dependent transcriptional regulator, acetoin dehydrogenase operon transcriptional activator AcoR
LALQNNLLMNSPFFVTREERIALARRRYFEEGILPTGIVSDAVFQSWTRCHRANQKPHDKIEFQPVSLSRSQLALQKNRTLHEAWLNEMPALGSALGSANCSAILTDASGVLIGATPSGHLTRGIIPVAHRVGVNLSEEHVGTSAPGIVARTGKQASVLGAEHYANAVNTMYCTAAPIRNIQGQLAGILDISSEGKPFKFDPASVVGLYAASIENRLLVAQSEDLLIVKFQFLPAIIDTPMVAMLGFDLGGQLVWLNSVASNLLSMSINPDERDACAADQIFDSNFGQLASLVGQGFQSQHLRNGLHVFVTCELRKYGCPLVPAKHQPENTPATIKPATQASGTQSFSEVSMPSQHEDYLPADSLRDADADLIRKCLVDHKGNVSQVAKRLKVSRGLIYRRLKELSIDPADYKK